MESEKDVAIRFVEVIDARLQRLRIQLNGGIKAKGGREVLNRKKNKYFLKARIIATTPMENEAREEGLSEESEVNLIMRS